MHPLLAPSFELDYSAQRNIVVPVDIELDRFLGVIELVPPFLYGWGIGGVGYDLYGAILIDMPSCVV